MNMLLRRVSAIATSATLLEIRSSSGVGGLSAVRRRVYAVSFLLALAALFTLGGALVHAGPAGP
jgi:hypothetical protein